MNSHDFLSAVLPSSGHYFVAHYNSKKPYLNEEHVVSSIDEMVEVAQQLDAKGKDAFFALGTLDKASITVQKLNKDTGQLEDSVERRTKANIKYISVLFSEIDVDPSGMKGSKPCFASQAEAVEGIKQFAKILGLPKPTLVNSGGGIHVYWRIEGDVAPEDQSHLAAMFRALVSELMPKVADVGVMTDIARVLRVPDTHNYKQSTPRPTKCLSIGSPHPYEFYENILTSKMDEYGLKSIRQKSPAVPSHFADVTTGNIPMRFEHVPPLRFEKVIATCQQIKWAYENQNDVTEPQWMNSIRVLQKCEDHVQVIHDFSKQYKRYSEAETDAKIAHVTANYNTPVTCAEFDNHRPNGCLGCPHADRGSSPAWLARDVAIAEPPTIDLKVEVDGVEVNTVVEIPNPPLPYARTQDGKVVMLISLNSGETDEVVISPYDLFPTVRRNAEGIGETTVWRIKMPYEGWKDIEVPSTVLGSAAKLIEHMTKYALYLAPQYHAKFHSFMITYLLHHQSQQKAISMYSKLGWNKNKTEFVLNDEVLQNGAFVPTHALVPIIDGIGSSGTLDGWIETMRFFNDDSDIDKQFGVATAFASTLVAFSREQGVTVNYDGHPGTGKSTVLKAAATVWGDYRKLLINGGNNGASVSGRYQRLDRLNSIVACMDEISTLDGKAASDLVHQITQGQTKLLNEDYAGPRGSWALIALTSSNGSLFHKIGTNTTTDGAGEAVRVFEIYLEAGVSIHTKRDADNFIRLMGVHYGHAGKVFVSYVAKNSGKVAAMIDEATQLVDSLTGNASSDRFRTMLIACVYVALKLCNTLGLLTWSPEKNLKWAVAHMSKIRDISATYLRSPTEVLANFLDTNKSSTLILTGVNGSKHIGAGEILEKPTTKLLIRHEHDIGIAWIQRQAFQIYCAEQGADHRQIESYLVKNKILLETKAQKSLGANTVFDKSVTRCWKIDLNHTDISGRDPDEVEALARMSTSE